MAVKKKVTKKQLQTRAKRMRLNPTKGEQHAKNALKKARIGFKTQVPFKYYILDFIIPNRLLILEVDGSFHNKRKEYDKRRDSYCRDMGLKVLRVKNGDETIVKKVKRYAKVKNYKSKLKKIMDKIK